MNFQDKLAEWNACGEARDWVGERTLEQAWAECPCADWMLWLAEKAGLCKRTLVGVSAAVARDVLPIFEARMPGDNRVRDCLDACDRYAEGEELDLRPHRRAAYAANADAAAATYYDASAAAGAAAAAVSCADLAASFAADAYARRDARERHAGIVRKMIPVDAIKEMM